MGATIKADHMNNKKSIKFHEALELAGTGLFQYFVVIVGGSILLCSYISVGAVAFILPAAQCDLDMDSRRKGNLASIGFLGLIISCHFWGFLSDTLGRKYILLRCLILDGILYLITSFTPFYSLTLVLRLLNGIVSSGGVASIYAYIGEFHADKHRTKALILASTIAAFAYFLMPVYGWMTLNGEWKIEIYPGLTYSSWRLFYAGCGVPSLICAALIYFLPESPKFLLAVGKPEEAIKVLSRISRTNNTKLDESFLIKNLVIDESEKVATLGDNKNKAIAFFQLMWDQTVPLFRAPHRLNIALVCLAQYLVYFSNGGMNLWIPETMNRFANYRIKTHSDYGRFCQVVQYESDIASHAMTSNTTQNDLFGNITERPLVHEPCSGHIDLSVYQNLIILGVIQSCNLAFIALLSKVCNKKLIMIGLVCGAIFASIVLWQVEKTKFAIYGACLLILFTGALIPMVNSVMVELFPTNLRGMAACLTLMSCRIGTVTTNIIAGLLIDTHCNEFVLTFLGSMIVCLLTLIALPTKPSLPAVKKTTTDQLA